MKKICVIANCGYGDFVCLTPLFESIAKKEKDSQITVVGNEVVENLLYNNPFIDEYISSNGFDPKRVYDRVINLDLTNSIFLSALYKKEYHYYDIAEQHFDYPIKKYKIFLDHTKEEKDFVEDYMKQYDNPVIIHTGRLGRQPFGKSPNEEFWDILIRDNPELTFLQTGTKTLGARTGDMKLSVHSNLIDLRDKFTVKQTALLLKHSLFHISIDSVNAHLSAWADKKGIVIWGCSTPEIYGHSHNENIWDGRDCSPCQDNIKNVNCCQKNGILHVNNAQVNKIIREKFFDGKQWNKESSGWKVEG